MLHPGAHGSSVAGWREVLATMVRMSTKWCAYRAYVHQWCALVCGARVKRRERENSLYLSPPTISTTPLFHFTASHFCIFAAIVFIHSFTFFKLIFNILYSS